MGRSTLNLCFFIASAFVRPYSEYVVRSYEPHALPVIFTAFSSEHSRSPQPPPELVSRVAQPGPRSRTSAPPRPPPPPRKPARDPDSQFPMQTPHIFHDTSPSAHRPPSPHTPALYPLPRHASYHKLPRVEGDRAGDGHSACKRDDADHGQPPVLELHRLQLLQLGGVR